MAETIYPNAQSVLERVEEYISEAEKGTASVRVWCGLRGYRNKVRYPKFKIDDLYNDLSIFDWWVEELSVSKLKQMRDFLKTAIKLGYAGYVCFNVGVPGCSHGMWAYKEESKDGDSPDGAVLHHSFRTGDNYWDVRNDNGDWLGNDKRWKFSLKEVKAFIGA